MFVYLKLTLIWFLQKSMQERKEDKNEKRIMSKSPEDNDNNETLCDFKSHGNKETTLTCFLSFDQLIVTRCHRKAGRNSSQR
jgi:hypothetical protein